VQPDELRVQTFKKSIANDAIQSYVDDDVTDANAYDAIIIPKKLPAVILLHNTRSLCFSL